jgi:HEPN domain-containing protein
VGLFPAKDVVVWTPEEVQAWAAVPNAFVSEVLREGHTPTMRNKVNHTRAWLLKAASELLTVQRLLDASGPYDTACFHAQQAVEKALKAVLAWTEQPIPQTHNLEELELLCRNVIPAFDLHNLDIAVLMPYAVRDDLEFWPPGEAAEQALDIAQRVYTAIVAILPAEARP